MFMTNLQPFRSDRKKHYYARLLKRESDNVVGLVRTSKKHEKSFWEYEIQVEYLGDYSYNLVRDIPQKAIPVMLKWIKAEAPDLYFAVILQLCCGLREGEVVNVRRASSCFPGGIRYNKNNGDFTSFSIDLRQHRATCKNYADVA